jgi:nicotinamidase-related amidase
MSPNRARTAVLVIDMFNTYDFEDADKLLDSVQRAAPNMHRLVERAREEEVGLLFVNDNYGDWNASRDDLVNTALDGRGGKFLEPLAPREDELMIHKARHSIFYQTPMEYLLFQEGFGRLVLAGQVTEQCILYSALDAYLRHFEIAVPRDCVAGIHEHLAEAALEMMRTNMDVDTTPSADAALTTARHGAGAA